jgi:hypothetical protein
MIALGAYFVLSARRVQPAAQKAESSADPVEA